MATNAFRPIRGPPTLRLWCVRDCSRGFGAVVYISICPTFSFLRLQYRIQVWDHAHLHSLAGTVPLTIWTNFDICSFCVRCLIQYNTIPSFGTFPLDLYKIKIIFVNILICSNYCIIMFWLFTKPNLVCHWGKFSANFSPFVSFFLYGFD